ncbi:MAG: hypothetical protein JNK78_02860 [Planctomycetes bacterium]|nr:hypothetical protein [Planctomycetota bacterium]
MGHDLRIVLLALVTTAACSNGSGGGGEDLSLPTAQISAANAVTATQVTMKTAFGLADAVAVVVEQLPGLTAGSAPGPQGGQVLRTFVDRDGDGAVSTGDECTFAFAGYVDQGVTWNGAVRVDRIEVQGPLIDPYTSELDAHVEFIGIALSRGATVDLLGGELRIRRENRLTVRLLGVDVDRPFSIGVKTLRPGTHVDRNDFPLVYARAWSAKGTVESAGVAGSLAFDTEVPFAGSLFSQYPWSGMAEVLGRGSRITVKAIDYTSNLMVEVDADDDGEVEETIDTTWADL